MLLPDDPLGDLRAWVIANSAYSAVQDVKFRAPLLVGDETPAWPLMVIRRIGGAIDPGSTPTQALRISIDLWGKPIASSGFGNLHDVTLLAQQLESDLWELHGPIGATTYVLDCTPDSVIYSPDDDGHPRYVVGAVLIVARRQ